MSTFKEIMENEYLLKMPYLNLSKDEGIKLYNMGFTKLSMWHEAFHPLLATITECRTAISEAIKVEVLEDLCMQYYFD
jgi:hypothetical protein